MKSSKKTNHSASTVLFWFGGFVFEFDRFKHVTVTVLPTERKAYFRFENCVSDASVLENLGHTPH